MIKITTNSSLFLSLCFRSNCTKTFLVICFLGSMFSSCKPAPKEKQAVEDAKEVTAIEVVENAIEKAGTMTKWKNIASLAYTKKSRLLLENGEIESEITQRHSYVFKPNKEINIAWTVKEDSFLIVHTDSVSQKFKNNRIIEQGAKVKASVNSAMYVLGMPFKLLDKGTTLSYEGLKPSNTLDSVHSVKVTYAPNKHQNHATNDKWWYYFNKNTGAFEGSMVYHSPTYALIENTSVIKAEGIIFPGRRNSYRCDSLGNKLFLRAEFWYDDYTIMFRKE